MHLHWNRNVIFVFTRCGMDLIWNGRHTGNLTVRKTILPRISLDAKKTGTRQFVSPSVNLYSSTGRRPLSTASLSFLCLFHQRHARDCTHPLLGTTLWCSCKHHAAPRGHLTYANIFSHVAQGPKPGSARIIFGVSLKKESSSSAQVMFHARSSLLDVPPLPLPHGVPSLLPPSHGDPHLGSIDSTKSTHSSNTYNFHISLHICLNK